MSQILERGNHVRLLSEPDGYSAKDYKLTVGNIYLLKDFMGSCVVTTTDEPGMDGIYWRGRVERTDAPLTVPTPLTLA